MKTKQEYSVHLKHLIHLDKLPLFEFVKMDYSEIPLNAWSYFPRASPNVWWKQQAEGYTWVIGLDVDKNGIIRKISFLRGEWMYKLIIPDQVANDSLNALKKFYPKTQWWQWGAGIVTLLIILNLFRKPRVKKKKK